MDSRWFIDRHEDGSVERLLLPNGHSLLYRSMWVHDGLELDRIERTVTLREQLDTASDLPIDWQGTALRVRREHGRWQVAVEESVRCRWITEEEETVQRRREFAERYPSDDARTAINEAMERLRLIQSFDGEWLNLATDVSRALDEDFSQ